MMSVVMYTSMTGFILLHMTTNGVNVKPIVLPGETISVFTTGATATVSWYYQRRGPKRSNYTAIIIQNKASLGKNDFESGYSLASNDSV